MHKNLPRTIYLVIVMLVSVCLTSFSWAPQARTNTKLTRGAASASALLARNAARIGGCTVFPANNIWNYDISHLPVLPNSANYIASIGITSKLHAAFGTTIPGYLPPGFPYTVVPGTQPYVPMLFYYAKESNPGPYPIPLNAPVEGGRKSTGDRHVIVVDSGTCKLYETWSSYPQPDGSWKAELGAVWNLNSNALRPIYWGSADAAGLPILPGLVRYDEVETGAINHALRIAVNRTQSAFLWPARHFASTDSNPNLPPMGLRLRLKASFDISSFSPQNQVILTALKHYGVFVADNSDLNSLELSGARMPDDHWNNNDLAFLGKIHASDFEAVDESALQVFPDSGQVRSPRQTSTHTSSLISNRTRILDKLCNHSCSLELEAELPKHSPLNGH